MFRPPHNTDNGHSAAGAAAAGAVAVTQPQDEATKRRLFHAEFEALSEQKQQAVLQSVVYKETRANFLGRGNRGGISYFRWTLTIPSSGNTTEVAVGLFTNYEDKSAFDHAKFKIARDRARIEFRQNQNPITPYYYGILQHSDND